MSETFIDEAALKREYESKYSFFKELEVEAKCTLREHLAKSEIKTHDITSRVKQFDSLLKKAQNQKVKYPLERMNDIVGLRVICLFHSDIKRIADIVRQGFVVVSEDNKMDVKDEASFGYMSYHLIVTIKPEDRGARYDSLHSRKFEIQIRTVSMHAWDVVSHYLDYKTKVDIPKDLKRDFFALSGLFYVADKHFEIFFKARREEIKKTEELVNNPSSEMGLEINFDSLKAYLAKEFSDRDMAPSSFISPLVTELRESSYETLGQIDKAVSRGWEAFLKFEGDYPFKGGKYNDVGALKTVLEIVDTEFARVRGVTEEWNRKFEKYRELVKPA